MVSSLVNIHISASIDIINGYLMERNNVNIMYLYFSHVFDTISLYRLK